MRIIHTSDLHLCKDKPESINALKQILALCKSLSVDLLSIGGDLFDSERESDILRPELRKEFSDNTFEILAIPGNHDQEAYARNLDFGHDLKVITGNPFEVISYGEETIVALPFKDAPSEELYSQLKNEAQNAKRRLLLLHCTLDIGFSSQDFGEETTRSYFPITTATLSRLGYHYILAGHFHKDTCIKKLDNGGIFIYPGSPISHTRKEIGKRQVVLIDTETDECRVLPLNSFYYDKTEIYVHPGKENQVLNDLESWIVERTDDECQMEIIVKGFVEIDETQFRNSLEQIGKNAEIQHEYRNVSLVLDHPLFNRFKERLEIKGIEDKDEVEAKVLEIMSRLLAGEELKV